MYTPFLAHLMEYVGVFDDYARKSKSADQSFVSGLRDPKLSEAQQKGALAIYQAIQEIHTQGKLTDEQIHKKMSDLLKDHKTKAEKALEVYNLSLPWLQQHFKKEDTTFLKLVEIFMVHLTHSFDSFKKYQLLNTVYEQTPLNMFKTQLIDYLVYRAAHAKKLDIRYYTWTGPVKSLTYDSELAAAKEKLVLSYLESQQLIDNREQVRRYINDIMQSDGLILEQKALQGTLEPGYFGASAKIPVKFQYTPNKLHEMMVLAQNKLDSTKFYGEPLPAQSPTRQPFYPSLAPSNLTVANVQRLMEEQNSSSSAAPHPRTYSVTYSEDDDDKDSQDRSRLVKT